MFASASFFNPVFIRTLRQPVLSRRCHMPGTRESAKITIKMQVLLPTMTRLSFAPSLDNSQSNHCLIAQSLPRLLVSFLQVLVLAAICGGVQADVAKPESVYTELAAARCTTIVHASGGGISLQRCPGIAGHVLTVEDADGRQSVSVVGPDGASRPLSLERTVTTGFFTLGTKAEWRVRRNAGKTEPQALIIRVIANEDPEAPARTTHYLAVAKITPDAVCVTERIPAGAAMNERARQAADVATGRPCR